MASQVDRKHPSHTAKHTCQEKFPMGWLEDYAQTFIDGPVKPQTRNTHAVVEIANPTHLCITYCFRWGNGRWTQFSLAPNERLAHSWPYACINENRSPTPFVSFDYNLASAAIRAQEYRLKTSTSPHSGFGHGMQYRFVLRSSGRVLDLVQS